MRIAILNGPNLNLLGKREPHIYGTMDFEAFLETLKKQYPEVEFEYRQSNSEGEMINNLQTWNGKVDGIILNGAAFTHTSIALGDAVAAIHTPVVDVYISNVYKLENFRKSSYVSAHASGVIVGFGLRGYELAVQCLLEQPI
ncbi:MAG TPA: 3-dehydroquinate dehydratase [Cryomorphaceae bacterium]|nr:3-dehydroquinate dehydratase [Cryomorphaceae bacterium]